MTALLIVVIIVCLALAGLAGLTFLRHYKQGLGASADLKDIFSWGLHIQAFFFFGAVAGGLLMLTGFSFLTGGLLGMAMAPMAMVCALGCLAGGGLLLVMDLGRPFRSLFLMKPGGNARSPIIWDFACFSLCGLLALLFILNLVPTRLLGLWSFLTAGAGFIFLMAHTHFLLTREGRLTKSPFLALEMISSSLWSAAGLLAVLFFVLADGAAPATNLLCAAGLAAVLTSLAAALPSPGLKPEPGACKRVAPAAILLLISLICMLTGYLSGVIPALLGLCVLALTFLSKQHHVRAMQDEPLMPEHFGRFEQKPDYKPTKDEWIIFAGGVGVAVVAGIVVWHIFKLLH